jgi:hypothetical protein
VKLIIGVMTQKDRKDEEGSHACAYAHRDSPPQVGSSALQVQTTLSIGESNEPVELPCSDAGNYDDSGNRTEDLPRILFYKAHVIRVFPLTIFCTSTGEPSWRTLDERKGLIL